jgi:hypothetical protein
VAGGNYRKENAHFTDQKTCTELSVYEEALYLAVAAITLTVKKLQNALGVVVFFRFARNFSGWLLAAF